MSKTRTFKLPDLGEGLTEAEIVTWHVNVGDRVVADQPLLSVETDKAIVEIPSPFGGTVTKLHGSVGDLLNVGDALVEFGDAAEDKGSLVGKIEQAK
jgi:pyruvate dehydrogenase E2 component (dihydrolipoamide acetyltransferase)